MGGNADIADAECGERKNTEYVVRWKVERERTRDGCSWIE